MKKLILILLFIVFLAQPVLGAFTTSMDNRKTYKNAYRWTGKPKDTLLLWAQEVEDRVDGTFGFEFLYLIPGDGPSVAKKGDVRFTTGNNLQYYTTSWQTVAASTSSTLDEAYSAGQGITVDAGSMTLTTTDAANNPAMSIVHVETGAFPAFEISNAGTDPTIEITTSGTGADITGTSATWSISKAGLATFGGGGVWSTGDVLFDATSAGEDIQWDDSAQMMHFLDGAILGLGGAVNASADLTVESDGTNVLVEAATQDAADLIFGSTDALDIKIHANTNTDFALFDGSGAALVTTDYDIWLDDTSDVFFGSTKNIGFLMQYSSSKTMALLAGANSDDFAFNIGVDQSGVDLGLYGTTASAYMLWDSSNDALWFDQADIALGQTDFILFGDTMGTGDFSLGTSANNILSFGQIVAGTGQIYFGVSNDGIDTTFFGDAGGGFMKWDEDGRTNGSLVFDLADIHMGDTDFIVFGDGADWTVDSSAAKKVKWTPATGDGSDSFDIGASTAGGDFKVFGADTAATFCLWDSDADMLILDAADIALGDDDKILLGNALGTGDISISVNSSAVLAFAQVVGDTGTVTWGADNVGMDITWFGEDASAFMKWEGNGAGNNTLNITGIDSSDTLFKLTGVNTTTDSDTMTISHGGDGDAIQITTTEPAGVGIRIVGDAAQTSSQLVVDGATGAAWLGASNVGMLHLVSDGTLASVNASLLYIANTGVPQDDALGSCIRIIDSGNANAGTAGYSVFIKTTDDKMEAMYIDDGTVLVDETVITNIGYQSRVVVKVPDSNGDAASTIDADTRVVHVAAITSDADDWLLLPDGTIGQKITVICDVAFEIRTPAASTDEINDVRADGNAGVEYTVVAEDIIDFTCVESSQRWIAVSHDKLGAAKTIAPGA